MPIDPITLAALINAGVQAASAVQGGINSANQQRAQKRLFDSQLAENQRFYNDNYHGDYFSRADNQAMLRSLRETLKRESQTSSAAAAMTGATPEQVAARKEIANRTIADVYSRMGAMGQQYKDSVRAQYMQNKSSIQSGLGAMYSDGAQANANMMASGIAGFGQALDVYAKNHKP